MTFCNRCGAELVADARFCHRCGASVSMAVPPADLHRVLKVSGKPRITIKQRVPGIVEVKPGTAGEVSVDIEPKPLDTVIWNVSQSGDDISIDLRIRDAFDWPGHIFSGFPRTNVHVIVPSESDLDIRNSVDRASVTGVSGNMVVKSYAGIVSMQSCTGVIRARTGAGSIELVDVTGTVWADASAGQIAFSGSLSKGESRFRTRVGDIKIELRGEQDLKVEGYATIGRVVVSPELQGSRYDGREYLGRMGAGTGTLVVETTAGSIAINH